MRRSTRLGRFRPLVEGWPVRGATWFALREIKSPRPRPRGECPSLVAAACGLVDSDTVIAWDIPSNGSNMSALTARYAPYPSAKPATSTACPSTGTGRRARTASNRERDFR